MNTSVKLGILTVLLGLCFTTVNIFYGIVIILCSFFFFKNYNKKDIVTETDKTFDKTNLYYEKANIEVSEFMAFDLETTGLNYMSDEIIQISAVHFKNGEIIESFESLVKPKNNIPITATKINHITNYMVRNKPFIEDILPSFIKFIGTLPLVIHNAPFDMKFLLYETYKLNIKINNKVIDTLSLSRKLYKGKVTNFKLITLAKELNLSSIPNHSALDDATTVGYLYIDMLNSEDKEKYIYDVIKNENIINNNKENDNLTEFEIKCFDVVKQIIIKNNKDDSMLQYYKNSSNYFDIYAYSSIIKIRMLKKMNYILLDADKNTLLSKGYDIKEPTKSEKGFRVIINTPEDINAFEEIIIDNYINAIKNHEYYLLSNILNIH